MAAKKKETKKKTTNGKPTPRVVTYQFFVDEVPLTMTAAQVQARMNQAGNLGWHLIDVFMATPNSGVFRLYYQQP